ncbi:hypothetical protein ScPMuIL_017803 [Solemya velum]
MTGVPSGKKILRLLVVPAIQASNIICMIMQTPPHTPITGLYPFQYKRLANDFRKSCDNEEFLTVPKFKYLRCRYEELGDILESANHVLGHCVFGTYAANIPAFCLLLYTIVVDKLPPQDAIVFIEFLVTVSVVLVGVTWSGIKLSSKAQEPLYYILKADLQEIPEHAIHQISVFVDRLVFCPPAVSMYGLMDISKSSVLMILGTVLSYAVLILQLKPSRLENCLDPHSINITSTTATAAY